MTVSFKIDQEIELLDEFSDETFDLNYSIELAKEKLNNENIKSNITDCVFEKDVWVLENTSIQTRINLDFTDVTLKKGSLVNENDFLLVIKCWVANLLETRGAALVKKYFNKVKEFVEITESFTLKDEEKIRNILKRRDEENRYLIAYSLLNLFDFYEELDGESIYTQILLDIKEEVNQKGNKAVRKLPKSKDILMFSWILNDFFKRIDPRSKEYYFYYPIYLWWNLTNLIPMRPSEFCKIRRDCLFTEDQITYIRLPRSKQPKYKNQIQVVDKICIPKVLYQEILDYIENTIPYGETKTLISYRAVSNNAKVNLIENKIDPNYFTLQILGSILKKFYEEIIYKEYGKTINPNEKDKEISILENQNEKCSPYDIHQMIRPGDTRHFAFLNLMRQGYHPVEIARLGGHTTVRAQYHYHQHSEYWIDTDVLKLMLRFNIEERKKRHGFANGSSIQEIPSALSEQFKREFIFKPAICKKTKLTLKVGYCTDPTQQCKVKHCMLCDSWRISASEYLEKADQLDAMIKESNTEVNQLSSVLLNLFKLAISNSNEIDFEEQNLQFNQDLTLASKELDEAIHNYAKMLSIKEKVDN